MKPFLLLTIRAEEAAADREYRSFLTRTGLDECSLRRHRLEQQSLSVDLRDWSGIILGGGPFNVSDAEEFKSFTQRRVETNLRELLDEVTEIDFPFLGICYGNGMLGSHQGAEVNQRYFEVGCVAISLTDEGRNDPLLAGLPDTFDAFTAHKETVTALPSHVIILARHRAAKCKRFE